MRLMWCLSAVYLLSLPHAIAADNAKPIETVMRNHAEAVAKADQLRAKAVEKSRDDAVSQLVKLASKAYTEKDRVAETSAWKGVLTLDRTHKKARQYFTDLGTLEKMLAEIPEGAKDDVVKTARFVGKWRVRDNRAEARHRINADGTVEAENGGKSDWTSKLNPQGDSVIAHCQKYDSMLRYTPAGDKLLVEGWQPASQFAKSSPQIFGYAVREE